MDDARNVVIIGSGPAGWTAAIYASRAELKPLIFTGDKSGGQLMLTTDVENYPGFQEGIKGPDLMVQMRNQASRFGAEMIDANVTEVDFFQKPFRIVAGERERQAKTVIIATGAEAKKLGVPGEAELMGRGVSTCAVCDAPFYKEKVTYVIGGGDAAMEEALALAKFAKLVTIVHRRDEFRASKIMRKRVIEERKDKVSVWWNTEVKEIKGEGKVEKMLVVNNKTNELKEVDVDGIFLAIGHKPITGLFKDKLALDERGYILIRLGFEKKGVEEAAKHYDELGLVKYPTSTSVPGVFAAGDVVDFRYRQAVTAAGLGCMAALDAERWLEREYGV